MSKIALSIAVTLQQLHLFWLYSRPPTKKKEKKKSLRCCYGKTMLKGNLISFIQLITLYSSPLSSPLPSFDVL